MKLLREDVTSSVRKWNSRCGKSSSGRSRRQYWRPGTRRIRHLSTRKVSVLDVDYIDLKYTRPPIRYTSNTRLLRLFHTNFRETTVHCWRLGVENMRMLRKMEYGAGEGRNSEHPRCTMKRNPVGRFPRDAKIWRGLQMTRVPFPTCCRTEFRNIYDHCSEVHSRWQSPNR